MSIDDVGQRFQAFLSRYPADGRPSAGAAWTTRDTADLLGCQPALFTEWQTINRSPSYGGGLIRFVMPTGPIALRQWNGIDGWAESWPAYGNRLIVFAYDWLGRQIGLDLMRRWKGEPLVGLFEPGTGELLEVPATFAGFMQKTALEEADALFADSFFERWIASGHRGPGVPECVGYKRPLFVGGDDDVPNLELSDMDVYVTVCGQLYERYVNRSDGIT